MNGTCGCGGVYLCVSCIGDDDDDVLPAAAMGGLR